jgi:hypothetical protein
VGREESGLREFERAQAAGAVTTLDELGADGAVGDLGHGAGALLRLVLIALANL